MEHSTVIIIIIIIIIIWLRHAACGILVPRPGIKPVPPRVLTTGSPGKSR